jgi:biopolymer transport protein ExbB
MLAGTLAWNSLVAQNAPSASPEQTEAVTRSKEVAPKTTFWGLVKQGGWTMVPLGLLSAAAVGLIIYGGLSTKPNKMLALHLVPSLQEEIMRLHLEQAQGICNGTPCLLTNTLNAGLERLSDGILDVNSMEKAMEEASVHEVTAGLKPISYLSIIAQIAPMLGLLGTVSGMIKAFQKIGMGGMGKPELLAADIGEAMVTTATGLIIGIPAMFFYFYLKTRYMSNVSEMSRLLGNLCHQLVAAARRQDGSHEHEEHRPHQNAENAS